MRQSFKAFTYVLWLLLLIAAQYTFALWGILSKYLQAKPNAPLPPLRLVLLISLISEGMLSIAQVCRFILLKLLKRLSISARITEQSHDQVTKEPQSKLEVSIEDSALVFGTDEIQGLGRGSCAAALEAGAITNRTIAVDGQGQAPVQQQASSSLIGDTDPSQHAPSLLSSQHNLSASQSLSRGGVGQSDDTEERQQPVAARGLSKQFSRLTEYNPRMAKLVALAVIIVSFTITTGLQIISPGFVDPAIVQLVNQFTAVGTAVVQGVILRHRLPWYIWPSIALMIGGAIMIILPTTGERGIDGLGTPRGRLGFGMAIIALAATIIYFISIQATLKMRFSSFQLLHYFLWFNVVIYSILSLPIEGTNWTQQLQGWGAGDWLILVAICPMFLGSVAAIQHCIWRLGAPMSAMFLGLRLVFSSVMSDPVLGFTVIKTGVQIAGVVVTAGAVTAYAGLRCLAAQKASMQPAT